MDATEVGVNDRQTFQGIAGNMASDRGPSAPDGGAGGDRTSGRRMAASMGVDSDQDTQHPSNRDAHLAPVDVSEGTYRALFDSHPTPMWVFDRETLRFLDVNEAAIRHYGYTRGEFLERTLADIRPDQDAARLRAHIRNLPLDRPGGREEWRHRRKDGEIIAVEVYGSPVRFRGRDARLVVALDVTERVASDQKRRESEALFEALASAAPVMLWMADPRGNCEWLSRSWLEFTGRTLEEGLGTRWTEGIHPEDREPCLAAYWQSSRDRMPFHLEYRLLRQNGDYRWILDVGTPRYLPADGTDGAGGGPPVFAGYIGTRIDITEQKRVEEENARLLAETTLLAHRQTELLEAQQAFLKDVLFAVTDGVLRLCRRPDELPAPLGEVDSEPWPLAVPTLHTVRQRVDEMARTCRLPQERRFDLQMAVGEATMNAVVHAGGGTARVCADREQGILQVWIRDSGPGIAVERMHRAVLERGWTTAGSLGHGFHIMLQTADRIYLHTDARGTVVVIEKWWTAPEPDWMDERWGAEVVFAPGDRAGASVS